MNLNLDHTKKYLLACSFGPDSMALFFSYGIIGFLLVVASPLLLCGYWILRGLICIRKMKPETWLYAFGVALSFGIITVVGYTMFFSQTVFYLAAVQVLCMNKFRKIVNHEQ